VAPCFAPLSVRHYTDIAAVPVHDWDALTARGPASVSGSRPWVTAAFATVHVAAEPLLLAVHAGDKLIALLPLAVHSEADRRALRFAAAPRNDMTDLMVLPQYARSAGEAIASSLGSLAREGWTIELSDVDPDGALAAAGLGTRGLSWQPDDPAPVIDLSTDWAAVPSSHRRGRWDRALRRLRARHVVEFARVQGDQVPAHLPVFQRLRDARLRATGRQVGLPQPAFLEQVVVALARRGQCEFMQMLIDGRPVASDLYLLDRPVGMLWLRGLDPGWRRFPCGHLLLRASAATLAEDGWGALDLGRGAEPYKFMFGADARTLLRARSAAV
jgi:CelD/BcsL family acetyltransferase involved in cellulose biosynthesis